MRTLLRVILLVLIFAAHAASIVVLYPTNGADALRFGVPTIIALILNLILLGRHNNRIVLPVIGALALASMSFGCGLSIAINRFGS